ncbi:MAG: terminase small subunit [Clostridia bacterium]|nr:terminase small subunit [Clostridia bacterium]
MSENSAEIKVKLKPQQERFCREYVLNGGKQKEAAIAAGYSKKTASVQASRLLTNVNILSRVHAIQIEELKKLSVTPESVIMKFLEIYDRCMQAKPVMEWDYSEHKMIETGEYAFDSKGAINALTKIGDYLAMFKQNVNVNGELSVSKLEDLL